MVTEILLQITKLGAKLRLNQASSIMEQCLHTFYEVALNVL